MTGNNTSDRRLKKLKAWAENVPNLLAIVVALVAAGWLAISPAGATERFNIAFGAIALVMTLICVNQILVAISAAGEPGSLEKVFNRLEKTETNVDSVKTTMDHLVHQSAHCSGLLASAARMVRCPNNDPTVYIDLFGGFTGVYYAFNPAYSIESGPALSAAEQSLIDDVFKERYASGKCHACYLFLTGDEQGKKDLERFAHLMHRVADKCPQITGFLAVKQIDSAAASANAEIYFGKQHGRNVVVHGFTVPMETHGRPSFYCVTESKDVFERSLEQFTSSWDSSQAHLVNLFPVATHASTPPAAQPVVAPQF